MNPVLDLGEPSSKKPRRSTSSIIKCVICDKKDKRPNLRSLVEHGRDTLKSKAVERIQFDDQRDRDLIDRVSQIDFDDIAADAEVLYHKKCYNRIVNFTVPKGYTANITQDEGTSSESDTASKGTTSQPRRPVTRRSLTPWDKSLCIFCQKETSKETVLIMTLPVSQKIMAASKHDYVMRIRTAGISDLIAADAIYHNQCRIEFERRVEKAKKENKTSPRDICFSRLTDEVSEGISQGHVYTLLDVWHRYEQLLSELGESTPSYRNSKTRFKQRLEKELDTIIDFVPQLDRTAPHLLFPKQSAKSAIPKLIQKHEELTETLATQDLVENKQKVTEIESLTMLRNTAMAIRNDIRSTDGMKNCLAVNDEEVEKVVPNSLYLFLRLLVTGESIIEENEDETAKDLDKKVLSVAQDLVYIVSNCRKLTPKHVGLGLTLHQATRSKDLVNLLHAAGHCISYNQVRRIDISIAKSELQSFVDNGNVSVPLNIEPGKFVQFSADNIDIIEETLNGKGTFHATQMVAFQRGTTQEMKLELNMGKEMRLDVPDSIHSLTAPPQVPLKPKPAFVNQVDIKWYDAEEALHSEAAITDLSWVVTRMADTNEQKIPFWTGFNQIVSEKSSEVTSVGYLPILNAPAHDNDTLWTVILRCMKLSDILNQGQTTVLTLDEQLYCKAKMLQWSNHDVTGSLLLRLGSFHTALTFMRAIGKHMSDSGLSEVWTESGVFGENTAANNLLAKSYNRAVRAHKLTFEALLRILWPQFLEWLAEQQLQIDSSVEERIKIVITLIEDRDDIDQIVEAFNCVKSAMKASNILPLMQEFQASRSPTVKYWQQYLDMVSVLLHFIRAEREGDWRLHLSAFASMLPWFAIYDHVNYTRWGSVYLADMRQLETSHPDVYEQFMAGDFVVKKSKQNFNQLSTDQALEHVNKICKSVGGLVGITREESTRDRWCLTYNHRSQVSVSTYEMFGICDLDKEYSVWETKESNPARLNRDEHDVKVIMEQLDRFNVFKQVLPELINLTTMDVAPEAVATALLSAPVRGKEQITDFVNNRLVVNSAKFHDSIKQNRSSTLSSMYEVTLQTSAGEKAKTIKAGRDLFQRLLVSQEAGRDINLEEILCHELSNTPLSIADTAGKLLPCDAKSDLAAILESGATSHVLSDSTLKTVTIIDGQALVHTVGKKSKAKTFGQFAEDFTEAVSRNTGSRIDVVFDRYQDQSIKGATREKRSRSQRSIRRLIESRDVPFPKNWDNYISSSENKVNLAAFLSNELMASNILEDREIVTAGGFSEIDRVASNMGRDIDSLKSDHEEADTRIILHAKQASDEGYERLVVCCKDTDVLVLLTFFSNELCQEIWMKTGSFKAPKFIKVHQINIQNSVQTSLLGYHAITGCDTVSHFRGYGKKKSWKVFVMHPELLMNLGVGNLTEATMSSAELFICKMYPEGSDITSVNDLRCKLFRQGKVEPEKLPPAKDTLDQHIKRAHYQAKVWRLALTSRQQLDTPVGNGWQRDVDGTHLKPVLTTIDPVPQTCVAIISCGCKSCATRRCKCRQEKILCTPACSCVDNVCSNPYNDQ